MIVDGLSVLFETADMRMMSARFQLDHRRSRDEITILTGNLNDRSGTGWQFSNIQSVIMFPRDVEKVFYAYRLSKDKDKIPLVRPPHFSLSRTLHACDNESSLLQSIDFLLPSF